MYNASEPDTSVFTPASLQAMCETERVLIAHPRYTQFCKLNGTSPSSSSSSSSPRSCVNPPMSVARLFYSAALTKCGGAAPQLPCASLLAGTKAAMGAAAMAHLAGVVATSSSSSSSSSSSGSTAPAGSITTGQSHFIQPDLGHGGHCKENARRMGMCTTWAFESCPLLPMWHVGAVEEWLIAAARVSTREVGFFLDADTLKVRRRGRGRTKGGGREEGERWEERLSAIQFTN